SVTVNRSLCRFAASTSRGPFTGASMSVSPETSRPFHSTRWEPRIYPGSLSQASRLRRDIRRDLAGFPDDTVHTLQLCCSELFANAVAYTASGEPGGEVVRCLNLLRPDLLRLEVTDGGWTDRRPAVPDHRTPEDWAEAEGQRGLLLLTACATAWGYFQVLPRSTLNLALRVWAASCLAPDRVPSGLGTYVFTASPRPLSRPRPVRRKQTRAASTPRRPYPAPRRAAGSRTHRDDHATAPALHRAHLHTPRPARPRRPHRPQGTPLQPPAPLRPAPPGLRARPPGGAACHHPDPAMAGPAAHRTHPRPPRHRHRAARPPLPRRPRPPRRLPHADPPPVRPAPVDLPPFRRLRDRPLQLHRPGPALRRLPHRPTRLSRSPRSAGGGAAVRAARGRAPLPRVVVLEGGDHGRDQAPGLVEGCLGERRGADHRAHQADPDQQRAHEFGAEPGVVGAEALGEVGEVVGAELIAQPG